MRSKFRPYHLIVLSLIGSVAVLSLAKINKHNFYHHYFKSIAELEDRNSQLWSDIVVYTDQIDGQEVSFEQQISLNHVIFPISLQLETVNDFANSAPIILPSPKGYPVSPRAP